jgi:hypothetical protein
MERILLHSRMMLTSLVLPWSLRRLLGAQDPHQSESARGNTAFTSERLFSVQPTPEGISHSIIAIASHWHMLVGGAAIGELSNPPEGHGARFGDMVVGKTRKVGFVPFMCYLVLTIS